MCDLKVTQEDTEGKRSFRLKGGLVRENLGALQAIVLPEGANEPVWIDLAEVSSFDSFGVVRLLELTLGKESQVKLTQASPDLKAFILRVPYLALMDTKKASDWSFLQSLGEGLIRSGEGVWKFLALSFEFVYWIGVAPFRGRKIYINRTIHEIRLIGVEALPIVAMISMLLGVILALNAVYQLEQFGAKLFVANLVAVSLTRELGPIITAIIVAGRTGSAIAAELGTMIVTEEIDALRVTGIHPTSFLIVPKILACCLALPCLVIMADVLGILGGLGITVCAMNVDLGQYIDQTLSALVVTDVLVGLVKSVVFGLLIGLTGATLGMRLKGGAEEVGRVTTTAVVISFFLLILADLIFTLLFALLGA